MYIAHSSGLDSILQGETAVLVEGILEAGGGEGFLSMAGAGGGRRRLVVGLRQGRAGQAEIELEKEGMLVGV